MQRITNQATPALVTANREDAPGAAPALSGLTAVKSWTPTDLATKHCEAGNIVRDLRQELGLGASDITALRACLSTLLRPEEQGSSAHPACPSRLSR